LFIILTLFQRAHREKWETTERSGETSGRSQLLLIEILFRDPSDVTLPRFSKLFLVIVSCPKGQVEKYVNVEACTPRMVVTE
jgi:hypothetical protein